MKKTIFTLMAILLCSTASARNNPQVGTREGIVEGLYESGISIFKGIPFAAPPVGQLRWKAPQPAAHWAGVRQAREFGPNPMQEPVFGDMNFGTRKVSEDCLYLNIWTPAKTFQEKLPVIIYFNGGGLIAGSGSEPRYDGMSMARKGIVAITANYREGIFGFFAHPQLSRETTYKGSGDYGFLDQVAAIRWVKDNIAAFGGDPDHITIAGESAGSMSVSILMASPLAKGLFQQAIGSSGSVMGFHQLPTLKQAERAGMESAKKMGFKNIRDLRALSAEKLMKLSDTIGRFTYNIDNYFIPEQPVDIFTRGGQAQVPLLIGGNSLESALPDQESTVVHLKQMAQAVYGSHADEVLGLYGITTDAEAKGMPGHNFTGDLFIAFSTWKWGNMQAQTCRQPVYRYLYAHPRPVMRISGKIAGLAGGVIDAGSQTSQPRAKGAVHSADIEYAMGNLPTNRVYDWQPDDYMVSDIFENYYANFIKTGNPNGLGLPEWTPVNDKEVPPVLLIDTNTCMKTDPAMENRYQALDRIIWGHQ